MKGFQIAVPVGVISMALANLGRAVGPVLIVSTSEEFLSPNSLRAPKVLLSHSHRVVD